MKQSIYAGKGFGGTGQAIRIAQALHIPVYNLRNDQDMRELCELFDVPQAVSKDNKP
jgi:hypothetical protein